MRGVGPGSECRLLEPGGVVGVRGEHGRGLVRGEWGQEPGEVGPQHVRFEQDERAAGRAGRMPALRVPGTHPQPLAGGDSRRVVDVMPQLTLGDRDEVVEGGTAGTGRVPRHGGRHGDGRRGSARPTGRAPPGQELREAVEHDRDHRDARHRRLRPRGDLHRRERGRGRGVGRGQRINTLSFWALQRDNGGCPGHRRLRLLLPASPRTPGPSATPSRSSRAAGTSSGTPAGHHGEARARCAARAPGPRGVEELSGQARRFRYKFRNYSGRGPPRGRNTRFIASGHTTPQPSHS